MLYVYFLIIAIITIWLSFKLSYYADLMGRETKINKALIGGILLAGITSLPELVTCSSAIFLDNPYLAIGDILGSNFFNITMISLFDIIFIKKMFFNKIIKNYNLIYLILIINYFLIYISLRGSFNYIIFKNGLTTFIIIATYLIYLFNISKESNDDVVTSPKKEKNIILKFIITAIFMIIVSILLTIIVNKVAMFNPQFSSSIVGAILLGITTSLPEVITFVSLIKLNNYDMALANIVGSNLFNLLVLAFGDLVLVKQSIYNFSEKSTIYLLIFNFLTTFFSFYQLKRKNTNNKIIYILPSLIIFVLYVVFWIIKY